MHLKQVKCQNLVAMTQQFLTIILTGLVRTTSCTCYSLSREIIHHSADPPPSRATQNLLGIRSGLAV